MPPRAPRLVRLVDADDSGRDAPVGGIDDQRGAQVLGQRVAPVPPEVVVGALHVLCRVVGALIGVEPCDRLLRERGRFLRGQHGPVAQFRGALQRGDGAEVPDAAEVRGAPGGPRRHRNRRPRPLGVEEREVDGARHRLVAGVVRMQPVVGVEIGPELRRGIRVADGDVEVEDGIVLAAGPDPGVHRLPLGLALRSPVERALERSQGARVDRQALRLRTLDQRPMGRDDVFGARLGGGERHPDVVDRLEHDDVRDAGLQQHVAVETRERIRTEHRVGVGRPVRLGNGEARLAEELEARVVAQHAVAGDAHVEDAGRPLAVRLGEPTGQEVRPAAVRVGGRAGAVGDRVAKRHDRPRRGRAPHVDAGEVEPLLERRLHGQLRRSGVVAARRDVVRGQAGRMDGGGRPGSPRVAGKVEIDREVAERRDLELHRVAQDRRAALDRDRGLAPERERSPVADARPLIAQRDVGRADRQRLGAEDVADRDPHLGAGDAGAHHLPQRLVGQADGGAEGQPRRGLAGFGRRRRIERERPRAPGADPAAFIALRSGRGGERQQPDESQGRDSSACLHGPSPAGRGPAVVSCWLPRRRLRRRAPAGFDASPIMRDSRCLDRRSANRAVCA